MSASLNGLRGQPVTPVMLLRRACAADRQYSAKRIAGPSTGRLLRFAWHRRPPIFERQIDSFRISPSIASQHSVIRRTTPGPPVWRIGSYGDILSLQWKLVPAIFNASQPGRHRRRENDGRAGTMNFENRNGKSSRIPPRTYLTCRSSGQNNTYREFSCARLWATVSVRGIELTLERTPHLLQAMWDCPSTRRSNRWPAPSRRE